MNGIHDMGGMDGFGPVQPHDDEPFHDLWEKQVFAARALVRAGGIDEFRFNIESLPPGDYLSRGYFGRWVDAWTPMLVKYGLVTEEELKNPEGRLARVEGFRAVTAEEVVARRRWGSKRMQVDVPPKFQVGDRVVVRNEHPQGHTRHPRYVRGRRGQVHLDHGVYPFPDTVAHGRGDKPRHCYAVRFTATELWGTRANPRDVVYLDLFDDYLEAAS
jgi:nitrile hydratase